MNGRSMYYCSTRNYICPLDHILSFLYAKKKIKKFVVKSNPLCWLLLVNISLKRQIPFFHKFICLLFTIQRKKERKKDMIVFLHLQLMRL